MPSMPMHRAALVCSQISYKPGWTIQLAGNWLQVHLPPEEDGHNWKGRKWLLSEHMTEGEVVQTCLLAILQAEEHEAREAFHYKGKAIFGPHLSMNRLLEIANDTVMREHVAAGSV